MTDKRYPTRMHEVLGVEPGEIVTVMCYGEKKQMMLDDMGWMKIKKENYRHFDMAEWWEVIYIINHPGTIIRKPRLSEEQVAQLRALVTLGFRWLIKNMDCSAFAYTYMPEKMDAWWEGENADVQIFIDLPTGVLYDLVSWSDPEPLDIVQTLREAGVEVE